jgi:peptidoglycan/LPS O-acetylase OafA/YrhL
MSTGTPAAPPSRLKHQPALDGIRALAVLAVMLFHADVAHATGGFIGVDVFLVLSGFLITTLLLAEITEAGRVAVKEFWLRRARRLLPALVLVLLAVAIFGAFVAHDDEALGLRGDLLGSLFYVQNWRLVFSGQGYFAQFGSPSPLRHMWSLAIEEQWYLIWPLVFLGIVRVTRASRRAITAVILALTAVSAGLMALLANHGGDHTRAYYGTDTRAQALLIGAALAVTFGARRGGLSAGAARLGQAAGVLGAAFLGWFVIEQSDTWSPLYRGGFTLVALAAAGLIVAAMTPGPIRRLLSLPPLPAIGLISYGLYLWHWPVYVVLSPDRTGLDGNRLLLVRLAVTFVAALASYFLVERPIREQRVSWVRHRVAWIPITSLVTALAILALASSGAAAKSRPTLAQFAELSRRLNAPPPPGATRVLLLGDSIAVSLGFWGVPRDLRKELWIKGTARVGCGLLTGRPVSRGVRGESQDSCGTQLADDAAAVRKDQPNLAVLLTGGWEVFDREIRGRKLEAGSPQMEQALDGALDRLRATVTAGGAKFVILTTPCFSPARRLLGAFGEADRADPARVRFLNDVWRRYALAHPDVVVVDLDARVCPNGRYAATIGGATMRTDGVHFTRAGADEVWPWLGPELLRIAHQ